MSDTDQTKEKDMKMAMSPATRMTGFTVTNEEISAYAEGLATGAQARKVTAAALIYRAVRESLQFLLADSADDISDSPDFGTRAARLREKMLIMAQEAAPQTAAVPVVSAQPIPDIAYRTLLQQGGAIWKTAAHNISAFLEKARATGRVLETGVQEMTLPCFALANAASAPDLQMRRQTITTADGVRIEFQQLPGPNNRLRLLVDASAIGTAQNSASGYRTAFITLEERLGSGVNDRHILIVALGNTGRGFTDFTMGMSTPLGNSTVSSKTNSLPAPRGNCNLVGVLLSAINDWGDTASFAPSSTPAN